MSPQFDWGIPSGIPSDFGREEFVYRNLVGESLRGSPPNFGTDDIPVDNSFHDILTVFYNVRNGSYGPLTKGNHFKIKTIPEKGHDEISVHISSEQEEEFFRTAEGREKKDELLLNIIVPKEIFQSKTGELMVWSSTHFIPVETTVKDYILLGDLHAIFTHRKILF